MLHARDYNNKSILNANVQMYDKTNKATFGFAMAFCLFPKLYRTLSDFNQTLWNFIRTMAIPTQSKM